MGNKKPPRNEIRSGTRGQKKWLHHGFTSKGIPVVGTVKLCVLLIRVIVKVLTPFCLSLEQYRSANRQRCAPPTLRVSAGRADSSVKVEALIDLVPRETTRIEQIRGQGPDLRHHRRAVE